MEDKINKWKFCNFKIFQFSVFTAVGTHHVFVMIISRLIGTLHYLTHATFYGICLHSVSYGKKQYWKEIETKEVLIFPIFEAKIYNFHHGSFQSSDEQEVGQTRSVFWGWGILGFNSCIDEKGCNRRIQEISSFEIR